MRDTCFYRDIFRGITDIISASPVRVDSFLLNPGLDFTAASEPHRPIFVGCLDTFVLNNVTTLFAVLFSSCKKHFYTFLFRAKLTSRTCSAALVSHSCTMGTEVRKAAVSIHTAILTAEQEAFRTNPLRLLRVKCWSLTALR